MKSFFYIGILFLSSAIAIAQSNGDQDSKTTFTFGVNIIDNNNKNKSIVPFSAVKNDFERPFFASAELRFDSNFSASVSVTTNQLRTKTGKNFYLATDLSGQFYFDDYLFYSEKIETYVGIGLGQYFIENTAYNTSSLLGGGRYWFLDQYGVSMQGIIKIGLPPVNTDIRNNYQLNLGLVWRK